VDWYNLGALIYEMFMRIPPFFSKNKMEMIQNISNNVPYFPDFIPKLAKDFISKLLEKNPIQRNKFILCQGIKNHAWFHDIGKITGRSNIFI
jgi:serine/threonine protein kinase